MAIATAAGVTSVSRACDVCGSRQKDLLHRQRFVVPSGSCVHRGYDVVLCATCGFAFADCAPDQNELEGYYASETYSNNPGESAADKRRHENTVNNLLKTLQPNDRILDIGCGGGSILALLNARGFSTLAGLEPSETLGRLAAERSGAKIVRGALSDHPKLGVYDFVILSHVLEHITDLRATVSCLHPILAPGGRVYIEVPDAHAFASHSGDSIAWDFAKDLFAQFCPEHVNFFSKVSLKNLMHRHGFRPEMLTSQISSMGVIASVWRQIDLETDDLIRDSLKKYVATQMAEFSTELIPTISAIVSSGDEIMVWGVGLHTQRLLAITDLGQANIRAFVDTDPCRRQGVGGVGRATLLDKPILSPMEAAHEPESCPIMISSKRLQGEIKHAIRRGGLKNRLILLYPDS